jgi:hypothetical protein
MPQGSIVQYAHLFKEIQLKLVQSECDIQDYGTIISPARHKEDNSTKIMRESSLNF